MPTVSATISASTVRIVSERAQVIVEVAERPHSPADGRAKASPSVRWSALLGGRVLFKDLIRTQQQRRGDRQPERLGGPEIDHQLEPGRLLDGEIARLGAFEDLVNKRGGSLILVTIAPS